MNIIFPTDLSSKTLRSILRESTGRVVFVGDPRVPIEPAVGMFQRMVQVLEDTAAGLVYADAFQQPRIDYRLGSIRDTFDFGPVIALDRKAALEAMADMDWRWGGLYDLRLSLSESLPIVRIPEPLYAAGLSDARPTFEKQFDYVDPANRDYQIEMERIGTAHLQRIGAHLEPRFTPPPVLAASEFPVHASVIIPVRNRERTIGEAVASALSQQADFDFNVIVVDNHSTDRTTELLRSIDDFRLKHTIPQAGNLGIGGCWNEAIFSLHCGRFAVQLDSDDLYKDDSSLAKIVAELERGPYAMVVGSYTMVNFSLDEIPPGLIDHREWTRENGRNNALRINGLGAPRAFDVAVLRRFGFPNVSYGEDYAIGLRISREYEVGRIYESVYLCRRWEGNTDSALPLETANRYDSYKDWIRSNEIRARRRIHGH